MMSSKIPLLLAILLVHSSCSYRSLSPGYQEQYRHLQRELPCQSDSKESDFFLVLLVDARHLDYTDNCALLQTMAKHPSDGSKNGDVGHAWIYLKGVVDGKIIEIEGGHSGELGQIQPKYLEGVVVGLESHADNPIRYLWNTLNDGFFQRGCGDHLPTTAVKKILTADEFHDIYHFIDSYQYCKYSLTQRQCVSFVADVAAFAGLSLDHEITIAIDPQIEIGGEVLHLWQDPRYSYFTFSSPDVLEKSLIEACLQGTVEDARFWYIRKKGPCYHKKIKNLCNNMQMFPSRVARIISLQLTHSNSRW